MEISEIYMIGMIGFYGISTIVGYLYIILKIYDLAWFGFMVYQPL